ncbi:WLM-domain-containing protein [Pleomassaria siparia CBS 279.74]|uniref:WLM-domain-containing protein n=1 Tax=Pleomassaria siparia CBS 279.74 TaxID=1314801 RepID=A0A6G1JYY9_9PLEO|nr:WLM-domain-containing protein [Pleomassaria siparia CBS 279.74]
MREIDAHFDAYEHLKHLPREQEALHMLRKAASLVKPMMRKRGWKVGILAEFLPDEPQLLGLNINRTERILIRLRYYHDSRQFLSVEQVTDTLLHELSHIVWGPHDHNFNNLWNELREEHQSLLAKGYTGEGFLTNGQKLGGKRVPLEEMRRRARISAEKRKATTNANSGGRRLGGPSVRGRGVDMRKVIAEAATRRSSITEGCASGSSQAGQLVNQAGQDGFRTKAEDDDGNDEAIARALSELMEEEEMARLEQLCAPSGGGGLAWDRENGLSFDSESPSRTSSPASLAPSSRGGSQSRPMSRLVADSFNNPPKSRSASSIQKTPSRNNSTPLSPLSPSSFSPASPPSLPISSDPSKWACPQCTLLNSLDFLSCDACGLEQPPQPIPPSQRYGPLHSPPSLPQPPPASSLRGPRATPYEPAKGRIGWNCLNCGTFMETQWWTCSLCGQMKTES